MFKVIRFAGITLAAMSLFFLAVTGYAIALSQPFAAMLAHYHVVADALTYPAVQFSFLLQAITGTPFPLDYFWRESFLFLMVFFACLSRAAEASPATAAARGVLAFLVSFFACDTQLAHFFNPAISFANWYAQDPYAAIPIKSNVVWAPCVFCLGLLVLAALNAKERRNTAMTISTLVAALANNGVFLGLGFTSSKSALGQLGSFQGEIIAMFIVTVGVFSLVLGVIGLFQAAARAERTQNFPAAFVRADCIKVCVELLSVPAAAAAFLAINGALISAGF